MTLEQRLVALAGAIRDKINAMMPRLVPSGGAVNQVLTKTGVGDYATGWQTPSGGGGGSQEVFVQQTRPSATGPWIWWETDADGEIIDLTVNDGA